MSALARAYISGNALVPVLQLLHVCMYVLKCTTHQMAPSSYLNTVQTFSNKFFSIQKNFIVISNLYIVIT